MAELLSWPSLPLAEWRPTYDTLHMWTQIVGKTRMALTPPLNHWWHVTLYVSARGLTTSLIPYGTGGFEVEFDFIDHVLAIRTSDGWRRYLPLIARPVADFYQEYMAVLHALGIELTIRPKPDEVENPVPFAEDRQHASYDPEHAHRFWRVLLSVDHVLKEFRSRFTGKCSPVHFFWGSFDMAVTRFSGRRAPERKGANAMTLEAYSHEVSSAGWWPGGGAIDEPAFYSYAAPEPAGFAQAKIRPADAFYHAQMGEFLLPYEAVRSTRSPERVLLDFMQTTYEAAADLGHWPRAELDRANAA